MNKIVKSILWGVFGANTAFAGFNVGQGIQAAIANKNASQSAYRVVVAPEEKPLHLTRIQAEDIGTEEIPDSENAWSPENMTKYKLEKRSEGQERHPATHYNTSQEGIDLIKKYEGFRKEAYLCPANVPTIGYGTTSGVKIGDTITREQAETDLRSDVTKFESHLDSAITIPLTQNEFDSLTSFTYNVGPAALKKSTLLRKLNSNDRTGAANEFKRWNKGDGKVLNGLIRRRNDEAKLFRGK